MHLFDTDDPKVIASQKSFFITICVFAAVTYILALLGYPIFQLAVWSQSRVARQINKSDKSWKDMLKHMGRRNDRAKIEKDETVDENTDSEQQRRASFALNVKMRRFRYMGEVV